MNAHCELRVHTDKLGQLTQRTIYNINSIVNERL